MNEIIFTINCILPIFIIIAFGMLFKAIGIVDRIFAQKANKVVFNISLPLLIFEKVKDANIKLLLSNQMSNTIIFGAVSILISILILFIISKAVLNKDKSLGAFVQGSYRSNYALLGVPLIQNLYGESGVSKLAIMLAVAILLFNVSAVIILTYSSTNVRKTRIGIILSIIKNPLIIGTVAGLYFSWKNISIPVSIDTTVDLLGSMATPLALFCIGVFIDFRKIKSKLLKCIVGSSIKVIVLPIILTSIAVLMGLRNQELAVLFLLYASPTAVSSFIMAEAMGNDEQLAAGIVTLTTAMSAVTLFVFIYFLRNHGLII